jgi:hypothetical protein
MYADRQPMTEQLRIQVLAAAVLPEDVPIPRLTSGHYPAFVLDPLFAPVAGAAFLQPPFDEVAGVRHVSYGGGLDLQIVGAVFQGTFDFNPGPFDPEVPHILGAFRFRVPPP